MTTHENYIKRCLQIAKNGLGTTRPNPMVGAIIVHNNLIIGEGFTSKYGGNHAEVNAINSVKNKALLKEATLYVTLEPCSHFGKTPPCSNLIIEHNIPNVVIGCVDDNPEVAGQGIQQLKTAGCNVIVGVLEKDCKAHHKRFFTFHNKKRPYIILKWAETTNGFMAPKHKLDNKPVWITNPISRQLVHKWRAEEQAILVGTTTVIKDDPILTVRDWTGEHPIRVVLDRNNLLTPDYSIFNDEAETITFKDHNIKEICNHFHQQHITSVIIEGGSKTLQAFINEGIWDQARVFTGNIQFKDGVKAPHFSGKLIKTHNILNDTLRIYSND
ncbi:bifunctional diaminohydroxyphosphoribosylaminopyrimidine deaminase/5-amino-6-(5-phosphoribosylamino)uracil reductase RibD [Lacinutrix salivirga]